MSLLRFVSRLASAAAATILLAAAPALASAEDSVAAVWVPKQVQFVYQGFTTHFSCDGLRDEVRTMLEKLGAQDLKVRETPCTRPVGPAFFPGVAVNMRVLVPASSAEAAKAAKDKTAGPLVQAHWQEVVLMSPSAPLDEEGKCELIEQFKETFLPLFTSRNVKYGSTCVPYQIILGTHLSAEVLMPPTAKGKPR